MKDAIVSACHLTSVGQEQKLIQRAGPERDVIFNHGSYSVQTARQPQSRRAISLGTSTGTGDFVLQLIRREILGSEVQES